jgi:putative SOS response-associated peptidase YedK
VCGRFVQTSSAERLAQQFEATSTIAAPLVPRHNVAPSTPVPAVIDADGRRLGLLQWGFVPPWADAPDRGPRPINARSEGAADSRLFGPALARRRCIVPVDAWYEWNEEDGVRQPWLLTPARPGPGAEASTEERAPVAVAALWSLWHARPSEDQDGMPPSEEPAPLATVALMTTEATGNAAEVHHRMPLLVPDELLDDWLDPRRTDVDDLIALLRARDVAVQVTKVSRRVNDVRNDDAGLLEALTA